MLVQFQELGIEMISIHQKRCLYFLSETEGPEMTLTDSFRKERPNIQDCIYRIYVILFEIATTKHSRHFFRQNSAPKEKSMEECCYILFVKVLYCIKPWYHLGGMKTSWIVMKCSCNKMKFSFKVLFLGNMQPEKIKQLHNKNEGKRTQPNQAVLFMPNFHYNSMRHELP